MTIIQRRNLSFKPISQVDAPHIFYGYSSIEECVLWMNWKRHENIFQTIDYITNCIHRKYRVYSVYENDDFIGAFDLRFLENNLLEVGYVVAKAKWNQGYATEIIQKFLNDFKPFENVRKIIAHCAVGNVQSKRVLEKNGFKVKLLKKDYYVLHNQNNRLTDAYLMELSLI